MARPFLDFVGEFSAYATKIHKVSGYSGDAIQDALALQTNKENRDRFI
jgi:hypothetical protein